jgi:SAM-dependent methyltransferase
MTHPGDAHDQATMEVAELSCPACGGELPDEPAILGADRLHGIPGDHAVHVCAACGTGRTTPVVPTERLGELYPDAYNAYALPGNRLARAAATGLFRWRYWRALRRPPLGELEQRPPGRLLDVGSGRGDLGVTLQEWEVTGLEPSPDACAEARARGVTTIEGTLTAADVEGQFDAIVFQHSLEHVADPLDDLTTARDLLAPGGVVLVSLPNFASWHARRFGADWFHLDLPRHRSHFTPYGLSALLQRAGFEVRRIATSTSADGLPMSLQYRRYGERRYREGAALYAATAVTLASAPITALLDRDGDLLHAVASR